MLRKILAPFALLAVVTGLTVFSAGTASALGGETLGCRIAPGTVLTFNSHCINNAPSTSYSVGFLVRNETGTSTYNWSVPAAYVSKISSGCTSSSNSCGLTVPNSDAFITVSVTLTQAGQSETLSSSATLSRYCGKQRC